MTVKRILALAAAALLSVGTAAAQAKGAKPTYRLEPFMKYDPPITMYVGQYVGNDGSFPSGQNPQKNVVYSMIEKHIGVKFVPKFTAPYGDPYHQKMRLAIAANDLPDMAFCAASEMDQLILGGAVEDLKPYYDKYASENLKRLMSYNNGLALKPVQKGASLWGLPALTDATNGVPLVYVRKDWMLAVGASRPKTLEDLFELARTFKVKDPGKLGTSMSPIAFPNDLQVAFRAIMNAYGVYPGIFVQGSDGALSYGSIDPRAKTVLGVINSLYREGIIDKEFVTRDGNRVAESIAAGDIGIYFGEFWNPLWPLHYSVQNNPKADWEVFPVPPAKGVAELRPYAPLNVQGFHVIRKGYAHPEALIILMNHYAEQWYAATPTPFVSEWLARQGEDAYKNAMIHSWLPFQLDRPDKNLNFSDNLVQAVAAKSPALLKTQEEKKLYAQVTSGGVENWPWPMIYLKSIPALKEYPGYTYNAYLGSPTRTMVRRGGVLATKEREAFTKIIAGVAPLSAFDDFVAEWRNLGGTAITSEVNAAR